MARNRHKKSDNPAAIGADGSLNLKVDLSNLKIKDLILFEEMQGKDVSQADIVRFLDRVVVGGVGEFPLARFPDVMDAITREITKIKNPTDGQGKA